MNNIFIYGDSHALFSFKNYDMYNFYEPSITMFRIGRDNKIINFDNKIHNNKSIIIICYGEIDCRRHIKKQINLGKNEDYVINTLVSNYFDTIKNNVVVYNRIIVVGIIPPSKEENCIDKNTVIGTNEERINFTNKMNQQIEQKCHEYGYTYFYPYNEYKDIDGHLKYELSDKSVHLHIGDNNIVIQELDNLLTSDIQK